jgi:hypothetical protein
LILVWQVHSSWLVLPLYSVLVVKASLLECDGTMWWRVDDLWCSFLSTWSHPCLTNFASWVVHEHLVSYVVLLSHSFVMPSFCYFFCGSWHCVGPSALLLFLLCEGLADNTYPKEYTNNSKQGCVVIDLKVTLYAITELVLIFQLA